MKFSEMLHQMCHGVLTGVDVKALCKARGFPPEAATSRGVLEALFLSPRGLSDVFDGLDANEITVMHMLKSAGGPVDVAFFSRVYGDGHPYGTPTQRFKSCFEKVKQRLVRGGVIVLAETYQRSSEKCSKMERWRFALPTEFHGHLPALIKSARQLEGNGKWRADVVRDKLIADLSSRKNTPDDVVFQIKEDELRLNGKLFGTAELAVWQQSCWRQAISVKNKSGRQDRYSVEPHEATLCILSELPAGHWAAAEQLTEPLRVFCGREIDADAVSEAGWQWGLLAKRPADGKNWYRLAPEQPHVAPHQYLAACVQDNCVKADLATIPFDVLEQIVAISDQRVGHKNGTLLLTPNFVKLGRADDGRLASAAIQWLLEQTPVFADVYVKLGERRGKTILHEGVCIAKISDLSLKVSIKKTLGNNFVSLKNDFVAFPRGSLDDVRRVVKKSGHVVKEVGAK